MQKALFGTDSAFNGIINRGLNVFNMLIDASQQSLNGLLGISYDGYDPTAITQSLLIGGDQIFNDGSVGGLMGAFNQSLSLMANIAGLPFDGLNIDLSLFDPLGFLQALTTSLDLSAFGPALQDLVPVLADFGTVALSFILPIGLLF